MNVFVRMVLAAAILGSSLLTVQAAPPKPVSTGSAPSTSPSAGSTQKLITKASDQKFTLEEISHFAPAEKMSRAAGLPPSIASSSVLATMPSRYWWWDLGSFSGRPFGFLYNFSSKPLANGWYSGVRTTFRGSTSYATTQGFSWKPVTGGFIISLASGNETVTITGANSQYELLGFRGSVNGQFVWSSTRSQYTPVEIRRYFYR